MAKKVSVILSHWYNLLENFQFSSQEFYKQVEATLKSRNVPNLDVSRITYREGGPLSAKREYLRLQRKDHLFDLCAAPFGTGFFVSWWLGDSTGFLVNIILLIPVVGNLFVRFFRPLTYYKIDTALMFQESVHSSVLEVIDQLAKAKGLRALSETERKPILRDIYQR